MKDLPHSLTSRQDGAGAVAARERRRLSWGLGIATLFLLVAGLAAGSDGWSWVPLISAWSSPESSLIVGQIRAPRTVGAWLVGALLGLAGAMAQGLFRNPLADPYLLGSASGASLGVVWVLWVQAALTGGSVISSGWGVQTGLQLGLVGAAFVGAGLGVLLTLVLAGGAQQTSRLLLSGVIVGVVLGALGDLIISAVPSLLRGRQVFLLGATGLLGWGSCVVLAVGVLVTAPVAWRLARALDALSLGADTAHSLGLPLPRLRWAWVVLLALATGLAVSQAGLIGFVGLAAPHVVRRFAPATQSFTLLASAGAGGVLLLMADVVARTVWAPQEVPVGVLTALLGGTYLIWLLHRRVSL